MSGQDACTRAPPSRITEDKIGREQGESARRGGKQRAPMLQDRSKQAAFVDTGKHLEMPGQ